MSVHTPEAMIDGLSALRENFFAIQVEEWKIFELVRPVTSALDRFFDPAHGDGANIVVMGSWARGTAIPVVSDYDIAYELPRRLTEQILGLEQGGAIAMLTLIERLIREHFPAAKKRLSEGTLSVTLSSGVTIDLRPCLRDLHSGFAYVDGTRGGSWRQFDPHLGIEAFRKLDPVLRENLLLLCRTARVWKKIQDVPISGILIDTFAYQFIQNSLYGRKPPRFQDCLFRDFLRYLSEVDPDQEWWPAPGSSEPVFRKGAFESIARESHRLAQQAIEFNAVRHHRAAWTIWRRILGDDYAVM